MPGKREEFINMEEIAFKRPELEDREIISSYFAKAPSRSCERTFANVYLWARFYNEGWAEIEGTAVFRTGQEGAYSYTYPIGACSKERETLLKSMGFRCTLGCEERVNTVPRNPACLFELGRFNRPAGQSTERFLHRAVGED